jgi:IS1 family transposase
MDEMWSFVGCKKQQRWLWHGIDHGTGRVLAYVLAPTPVKVTFSENGINESRVGL